MEKSAAHYRDSEPEGLHRVQFLFVLVFANLDYHVRSSQNRFCIGCGGESYVESYEYQL